MPGPMGSLTWTLMGPRRAALSPLRGAGPSAAAPSRSPPTSSRISPKMSSDVSFGPPGEPLSALAGSPGSSGPGRFGMCVPEDSHSPSSRQSGQRQQAAPAPGLRSSLCYNLRSRRPHCPRPSKETWTSSPRTPTWCTSLGLVGLLILYKRFAPRLNINVPAVDVAAQGPAGASCWARRFAERKMQQARSPARRRRATSWRRDRCWRTRASRRRRSRSTSRARSSGPRPARLEKLGKLEQAAELYLQAGDYKKAAQVLHRRRQAGQGRRALPGEGQHARGGAPLRPGAASGTRRPTCTRRAATRCARPRPTRRRASSLKAAEAYEKHFMENVSYSTTYSSTATSRRPEERPPRRPPLREGGRPAARAATST